jgi:N-acetyl-gamma-glutamyl-phosphate reductase common form
VTTRVRVGIVGGRGHVGSGLLPLLEAHPLVEVAWIASRSAVAAPSDARPAVRAADPKILADDPVDALVLALPNGEAAAWVRAAEEARDVIVLDLSSDHRLDDAWTYGQPERFRDSIRCARRIAMPGCYATAAQLAIAPLRALSKGGAFHVFGVSGYSGAGTTPSERNDAEALAGDLLPYALVGHAHERELRRHLGVRVFFSPHVAGFFRGLVVTVSTELAREASADEATAMLRDAYVREPFVEVVRDPPRPRALVGHHGVRIGGVACDGERMVVVAALDNLLGGAASQTVRALNLAARLDEATGLST